MSSFVRNAQGCIMFFCVACARHCSGDYCAECGSRTRYATPEDLGTAIGRLRDQWGDLCASQFKRRLEDWYGR